MELNLQPLAASCFVSGQPFSEGDPVTSFLVRASTLEITRYDVLSSSAEAFSVEGTLACSWIQVYKPRSKDDNPDRTLKLTAENLFLTLAAPETILTPETTRLVQFLALMLERKKLIRPKGLTPSGEKNQYEHAKTKQMYEVPAGELTPEFFLAVQEQLSVLVGEPKPKEKPAQDPVPVQPNP